LNIQNKVTGRALQTNGLSGQVNGLS